MNDTTNKIHMNGFTIGESVAIATLDSFHPYACGTIEYIKCNGMAYVKDDFSGEQYMFTTEDGWTLDMLKQIYKWDDTKRRIFNNQGKIKDLSFSVSCLNPMSITQEKLDEISTLLINIK